MVTVTSNADQVAAEFAKLAVTLQPVIVKDSVEPFLREVQIEARRQHRYNRNSGKLERSIKISMSADGGDVSIDDRLAPYGKYVHEGTRKWNADKFLTEAGERKQKDLYRNADRATEKAIKQAGL